MAPPSEAPFSSDTHQIRFETTDDDGDHNEDKQLWAFDESSALNETKTSKRSRIDFEVSCGSIIKSRTVTMGIVKIKAIEQSLKVARKRFVYEEVFEYE
ncbi:hypothetical protein KIN20_031291 [Parelaphostrongylus tenuis]|uniref:Uncharacterized protein n=1 Tax=Parelaphostrongylus tenuis TaxID=148309 RepID=A0AAD5R5A9_PARTN|nr:hypothetical protein KIN20_031291 [Parelaphostrongylus tenuis]